MIRKNLLWTSLRVFAAVAAVVWVIAWVAYPEVYERMAWWAAVISLGAVLVGWVTIVVGGLSVAARAEYLERKSQKAVAP